MNCDYFTKVCYFWSDFWIFAQVEWTLGERMNWVKYAQSQQCAEKAKQILDFSRNLRSTARTCVAWNLTWNPWISFSTSASLELSTNALNFSGFLWNCITCNISLSRLKCHPITECWHSYRLFKLVLNLFKLKQNYIWFHLFKCVQIGCSPWYCFSSVGWL